MMQVCGGRPAQAAVSFEKAYPFPIAGPPVDGFFRLGVSGRALLQHPIVYRFQN